jgi:hypothetical protein
MIFMKKAVPFPCYYFILDSFFFFFFFFSLKIMFKRPFPYDFILDF